MQQRPGLEHGAAISFSAPPPPKALQVPASAHARPERSSLTPLFTLLFPQRFAHYTQTRGNQREQDRLKAQKKAAAAAGPAKREGTPQSRNEEDAAKLQRKIAEKAAAAAAAAAAGGGGAGGGGGKK